MKARTCNVCMYMCVCVCPFGASLHRHYMLLVLFSLSLFSLPIFTVCGLEALPISASVRIRSLWSKASLWWRPRCLLCQQAHPPAKACRGTRPHRAPRHRPDRTKRLLSRLGEARGRPSPRHRRGRRREDSALLSSSASGSRSTGRKWRKCRSTSTTAANSSSRRRLLMTPRWSLVRWAALLSIIAQLTIAWARHDRLPAPVKCSVLDGDLAFKGAAASHMWRIGLLGACTWPGLEGVLLHWSRQESSLQCQMCGASLTIAISAVVLRWESCSSEHKKKKKGWKGLQCATEVHFTVSLDGGRWIWSLSYH